MLEENPYLFTFFDYPQEAKKYIQQIKIEGANKQIKGKFKLEKQFPTEQWIEKYIN